MVTACRVVMVTVCAHLQFLPGIFPTPILETVQQQWLYPKYRLVAMRRYYHQHEIYVAVSCYSCRFHILAAYVLIFLLLGSTRS